MKRKRRVVRTTSAKPAKFSLQTILFLLVLVVGAIIGLNVVTGGKFNFFGLAANRWPFTNSGTPPNVMLEKDTLKVITYEDSDIVTLSGNVVFESLRQTDSECWIVWATLEAGGKRIGGTFPPDSNELFPPKETCPVLTIGKFTPGASYPAPAKRIVPDPLPHQNEGVLKNAGATAYRNFIFNIPVPKNICKLYLHYRSNRQGGKKPKETVFYEVRLPTDGCITPTPTEPDVTSIPTPTEPMPSASPEGCIAIEYFGNNTANNYSTCQELCGDYSNTRGYCKASKLNPNKTESGDWYCCSVASCNKKCSSSRDCSSGLSCVQGVCQDRPNCEEKNNCQCVADKVEKQCAYYGEDCKNYCSGTCYADTQCSFSSTRRSDNVYCNPKQTPTRTQSIP